MKGRRITFKRKSVSLRFDFIEGEFDHVEGDAALKQEAYELCQHVPVESYAVEVLLGSCKKLKPAPAVRPRDPNTCGHCFETQVEDSVKEWYECEACSRNCHAECADKVLGRVHLAEDAYFCPECVEAKAAKRIA